MNARYSAGMAFPVREHLLHIEDARLPQPVLK